MRIIEWEHFLKKGLQPEGKKASVTVGVFDGVHRGHRALIELVVSHNADYTPVIFTFRENHKNEKHAGNIQTFEQKAEMLAKLGIKILVVIDFTEPFKRMSGIEFLENLFKHIDIGFFAVGNNFRCGHGLDTNAEDVKNFFASRNIPVKIAAEVMESSLPISSSRIRAAIAEGDHKLAETLLGLPL